METLPASISGQSAGLKRLPVTLVALLLAISALPVITPLHVAAGASQGAAPWPMFRHDVRHTGQSPFVGPSTPTTKWNFATGGEVDSSPAIGTDGTVYIGSIDNNLYAINPDGTKKWEFATGEVIESSPAIGTDGTVYVGSGDTNLYAIGGGGLTTTTTALTTTTEIISSTTRSSAASGGGIPEFPYQLLAVIVFTVVVVLSYVAVRRQSRIP